MCISVLLLVGCPCPAVAPPRREGRRVGQPVPVPLGYQAGHSGGNAQGLAVVGGASAAWQSPSLSAVAGPSVWDGGVADVYVAWVAHFLTSWKVDILPRV